MSKTITINAKALRASTPSFRFYIADGGQSPVPHGFYLEHRFQTDAGTEVTTTYPCESTSDGGTTFTSVPVSVVDPTTGTTLVFTAAQITAIKNALVPAHATIITALGY
jgi:hypothetical protein